MGVEHGGSDKGPETSDKPTTPDDTGQPPPDKPGSPGQESRRDSLRNAGWTFNGQQEAGTEQNGDRGQTKNESTGSTGESDQAAAPATEKGSGTGKSNPEAGTQTGGGERETDRSKAETEAAPATGGEQRSETGTGPHETSLSRDTGKALPQAAGEPDGKAASDDRIEGGDKGSTDANGYSPPPDKPGSPGQESRIDSLRASGWTFNHPQETGADKTSPPPDDGRNTVPQERGGEGEQASDARSPELGEAPVPDGQSAETSSKDRPTPPESGSDGPGADESVSRNALGQEQDAGEPPTDQPGLQSDGVEGGEASRPQETGSPADTNESGDRSPATGQAPEGKANPPTAEPVGPQEGSREPLPQQDGPRPDASPTPPSLEQDPQGTDKPADNAREPGAEPAGETTDPPTGEPGPPQEATTHGREPEQGATEASPDGSTDDGHQRQPETSEPPENRPENPTPGEQTDNQRLPGDPPSPSEEADDRDKNAEAESAECAEPSFNTLPYFGPYNPNGQRTLTLEEARRLDNESTRPSDNEDPDSEVPPWLAEPLEAQDGPTRDDVGTRGRGEVGSPETDPAADNPLAPERPSRRRELLKEGMRQSSDVVGTTDKVVGPAIDVLNSKPPTGHPGTVRDAGITMGPSPQPPIKPGSAAIGLLGAAILAVKVGQWSITKINDGRDKDRASN